MQKAPLFSICSLHIFYLLILSRIGSTLSYFHFILYKKYVGLHDFKQKQEYMSFSNLFDGGFKKRNENHFAAIVRVAMDDGIITDEEQAFLDRLAQKLEIGQEDYKAILKNYKSHPINPPVSYDIRLERLYDLVRMVHVDTINGDSENLLLKKIGVGLGFHAVNVKYIIDKALTLVNNGADLDTFTHEIKHMNE